MFCPVLAPVFQKKSHNDMVEKNRVENGGEIM
jgi:hypothetical protein